MRIAGLLYLAVLTIVGCSEPPAARVPSPARVSTLPAQTAMPSPAAGPWAVMVHGAGSGGPYIVQLVTFDGRGGPFAQAMSRSTKQYWFPPSPCPQVRCPEGETAGYTMPETSISSTRVYFLDGEAVVKSLSSDGAVQTVMNISAPDNSQVVFSVSPDDRRIAVSVITLARSRLPASFTDIMYVEDLGRGSNRVNIYSSTSIGEWPVGWHSGQLIIGVGSSDLFALDNPYGAVGYHVVDPDTGRLVSALDCAKGLLVRTGSACATGWCPTSTTCTDGTLGKQGWDGSKTLFAIPANPRPRILMAWNNSAELSPDGTRIAADNLVDAVTGKTETILISGGSSVSLSLLGGPQGWLDDSHVVVSSASAMWIVEARSGAATMIRGLQTIPQQGMPMLSGILPTSL
jgi:hypothetical protein